MSKALPNARSWLSVEQIRAARMLADLSQEEAAALCGIPYPSWKGMERKRGRRHIHRRQMDKIVAGFERRGVHFTYTGLEYGHSFGPSDRSHQGDRPVKPPWRIGWPASYAARAA